MYCFGITTSAVHHFALLFMHLMLSIDCIPLIAFDELSYIFQYMGEKKRGGGELHLFLVGYSHKLPLTSLMHA